MLFLFQSDLKRHSTPHLGAESYWAIAPRCS